MSIYQWHPDDLSVWQMTLKNILWIGGATDAGKTTTAAMLAEKHDLPVYHGDKHWREHWSHIIPQKQPAMCKWDAMTMDERWVNRSVEDLLQHTLEITRERLPFIFADLQKLSADSIVIAEWFGFLPDAIMPLLTNPAKALWMFPTPEFKQAAVEKRGKAHFHDDTANPAKAWDNHLKRDLHLADLARKQAGKHNATVLINDGTQSLESILINVEAQFSSFLM